MMMRCSCGSVHNWVFCIIPYHTPLSHTVSHGSACRTVGHVASVDHFSGEMSPEHSQIIRSSHLLPLSAENRKLGAYSNLI